MSIDERDVVTTSANSAGSYSAPLVVPDLPVGQYSVVSRCAALSATSTFAVVLETNAFPTTTLAILIFFILIGIAVVRRQFA